MKGDEKVWPLAPSFLEGEQAERYQRGMSPGASLEDQVFYLKCRFDGHQMLLQRRQREIFALLERNKKNVKRAWHYRQGEEDLGRCLQMMDTATLATVPSRSQIHRHCQLEEGHDGEHLSGPWRWS